jgi:4'-phosphopantetheinyl transferase
MLPACQSDCSPAALARADNDVHVWRASLESAVREAPHLTRILSEDELQRASRFHFARDRAQFIFARATLRTILSSYLSIEPARIRFDYGSHGKPGLLDPPTSGAVCFNVSHCNALALYAVTRNRRVGIDVERLIYNFPYEDIAARFFSPHENIELSEMPPEKKCRAFFSCWTRKEAYVKARGEGLSIPLHGFHVSVDPRQRICGLRIDGASEETRRWSMRSLDVGPSHAAALVVEGDRFRIRYF